MIFGKYLMQLLLLITIRVFNSGRLGVNAPKNFSPYAQILRRGVTTSKSICFSYVYLSITSWKLTSESVFQCFVGSIIFADCRVSE